MKTTAMRLKFFGAVTCVATKGTSLHFCNHRGAELFVDGRLNSCPSNPFTILAWCVKIEKKTQQPSLERCATKVKFLFSGHKNADEHTIFLTLHYLRPTPKAVRVKDLESTVAPLPAHVAKPSAQEPLSVQCGATGTWEFCICRANREVSKAFALVVAAEILTSE